MDWRPDFWKMSHCSLALNEKSQMMRYQSTNTQKGHSDSFGKLKALDIPSDLSGKSFLDLGCNEGFFCNEARARGATTVVGVDQNANALEVARSSYPGIDFRNESWWSFNSSDRFDYIILTSAIHYEKDPKSLCEKIRGMLNPGGKFILEAGIVMTDTVPRWHFVQRHDGLFKYPTFSLVRDFILSEFAIRHVGPSVQQAGDPISRHVLHCTHVEPLVLLISGYGKTGKTVLANSLASSKVPAINIDAMILNSVSGNINKSERYKDVVDFIRIGFDPYRLDMVYSKLEKSEFIDAFASMIVDSLATEVPLTILEGYALHLDKLGSAIISALKDSGFRPWSCSASL